MLKDCNQKDTIFCKNCGKSGHFSSDCITKNVKKETINKKKDDSFISLKKDGNKK